MEWRGKISTDGGRIPLYMKSILVVSRTVIGAEVVLNIGEEETAIPFEVGNDRVLLPYKAFVAKQN